MCSYVTEKIAVTGSGKGTKGWFRLSHACIYFDHPYFTPLEHTLNIDFLAPGQGPSARVAVELSAESARALVKAIEAVLESAPARLAVAGSPRRGAHQHRPGRRSRTRRRMDRLHQNGDDFDAGMVGTQAAR